jgi:hypothetical protein
LPYGIVVLWWMTMRQCGNGHEVPEEFDWEFCPVCGERLLAVGTPETEEEPRPSGVESEAVQQPSDDGQEAAAAAPGVPPAEEPPRHRRWPLSLGWSIVLGFFTALIGLLVPLAVYFWRGGKRRAAGVTAALFALVVIVFIVAVATGSGGGDKGASASTPAATTTTSATSTTSETKAEPREVADRDGNTCMGDETKYGLCPSDKYFGLRPAVARERRAAAAKAKARARARAAARAAAKRKAEAAAAARAYAAANAWHAGYSYWTETDNGTVYYKWRDGLSCVDYALNGCWHIEVIAELGCSSLYVQSNEMQGGTVVGDMIASQDNLPAKTPALLELDADTDASVTASAPTITCY